MISALSQIAAHPAEAHPSIDATGEAELPIGVADLFKIGIGPSSSHTSGPMSAAEEFIRGLADDVKSNTVRLSATVFGSLAWTGKGHSTDKAIILGLSGFTPERVEPIEANELMTEIKTTHELRAPGIGTIEFVPDRDIVFDTSRTFARHPNAMEFEAIGSDGASLAKEVWFSIGGGFVEKEHSGTRPESSKSQWGYRTARELLAIAQNAGCSIADIVMANENLRRPKAKTIERIDRIIGEMMSCIDRGLAQSGELPGGLRVKRRAGELYRRLIARRARNERLPNEAFDYVSTFAMAVNEENAAGGRVVTAPTNGAAGVIPAVLRYYRDFCQGASNEGARTLLLTATSIGSIIKRNE